MRVSMACAVESVISLVSDGIHFLTADPAVSRSPPGQARPRCWTTSSIHFYDPWTRRDARRTVWKAEGPGAPGSPQVPKDFMVSVLAAKVPASTAIRTFNSDARPGCRLALRQCTATSIHRT